MDTMTADVQIEIRGRHIAARGADEPTISAIKSVLSSRWDPQSGDWIVPATPCGALELAHALKGKTVDVAPEVRELADEARRGAAASPFRDVEHPAPIPGLKTTSWDHQGRGFWFARENRAVMLDMDMGTGKSLVVVGLAENDQAKRILVVCPRNCLGVWRREFRLHPIRKWIVFNGKVPKKTGGWLRNATVARKAAQAAKALERGAAGGEPVEVVTNYEAFTQPAMAKLILETEWDMIVFDESHRLQDPGGKWSQFAARLDAPRKVCCTGTPFGQTPLTAYGQYRFLDRAIFGTNHSLFKQRYATTREIEVNDPRKPSGKRKVELIVGIRKDMESDFMERFSRISYGCRSEDVQDLPEFLPEVRDVELDASTRAIYDELDNEFIAWINGELEGEPVTAGNALVKSVRLQQIVNGYAKTDDGELQTISNEKQRALEEELKDIPVTEPVVVFCRFVADLDRIREVAEKTGRRYGELSGRRKDVLDDDAKMLPDIDIAAVQLQSGGVGIDLTRARIGIYYSLCDSLIQYQQSKKRLDRPGQERAGVFIHLLTETPIERKIYRALARNEQINTALLKAAREGWNTDID